jgi:hypothetical protein
MNESEGELSAVYERPLVYKSEVEKGIRDSDHL